MRLTPRWRRLLLVVHLAATLGWFGADLVLLTFAIGGARGADPTVVYPAAALVGTWVVAPAALVSLTTGLLQGLLTPWGLLRHRWVLVKLVLTTGMTGLVFFALVPGLREAADAGAALSDGARTEAVVPPSVAGSLLLIMLVLSVYKPRLAKRTDRRGAPGAPGAPSAPGAPRVSVTRSARPIAR